MDIFAQILGIVATVVTILSFQQKTQKRIAIMQSVGSVLWMFHYLIIGAYMGCLMNVVSLTKNLLLSKRDKWKWVTGIWFTVGVSAVCFAIYLLSFAFLNTDPTVTQIIIELLPVCAMIVSTVALQNKDAKKVRLISLLCSPMWLTYNTFNHSIGGVITETFSIISIIVGYLRLDRKKNK